MPHNDVDVFLDTVTHPLILNAKPDNFESDGKAFHQQKLNYLGWCDILTTVHIIWHTPSQWCGQYHSVFYPTLTSRASAMPIRDNHYLPRVISRPDKNFKLSWIQIKNFLAATASRMTPCILCHNFIINSGSHTCVHNINMMRWGLLVLLLMGINSKLYHLVCTQ